MRPSLDEPKLEIKQSEQGYVLITAIWLLILAGSIVAVVMLRTLSQAQAVKDQGSDLADKVVLEGAAETVFADRLFAGNKGRWWLVPASGQVMIGGKVVDVELSSESGRLDVNEADPKLIDQALQGLEVRADVRARVFTDVRARRADGRRINSFAELRSALGGATVDGHCLDDDLTLWSGLPSPRRDQMPETLARALGQPIGGSQGQAEAGAALRLRISLEGKPGLVMVARPTGLRDEPVSVNSWESYSACS